MSELPKEQAQLAYDLFVTWLDASDEVTQANAFESLSRTLQPWMESVARTILGNSRSGKLLRAREDSIDLVQNTWLKVLTRLRSLRYRPNGPGQLLALLKRIMTNDIVDRLRRLAGRSEQHLESIFDVDNPLSAYAPPEVYRTTHEPVANAHRSDESDTLWLAMQYLDDESRQLAVARFLEEKTWEQAAAAVGGTLSADAARMRGPIVEAKLAQMIAKVRSGRLPELPTVDQTM